MLNHGVLSARSSDTTAEWVVAPFRGDWSLLKRAEAA
jgi:hypothetical protein